MSRLFRNFWEYISLTGTDSVNTESEKREIRLLNRAWLLLVVIQIGCVISHLLNHLYTSAFLTGVFVVGLFMVRWLISSHKISLAKITAIVVINWNSMVMAVFLGEQTHVADFLLISALMPLYFFRIKERQYIFAGIAVSLIPYGLLHFFSGYLAGFSLPVAQQLEIYKTTAPVMIMIMSALLYLIYHKNAGYESELLEHITSLKEAEGKLMEYSFQLEKKNDDMRHFVHATSHDLKTPLRNIASFLQLIERRNKKNLDEDSLSMIGYTVNSVKHLNQLINGIYQYSVADDHKKETVIVDFNELLEEASRKLNEEITSRNVRIESVVLPMLEVCPQKMIMVFTNLIGNAIKYNNSLSPEVKINCLITEDEYIFSVADNGIGIRDEYGEKIFGMFQRLHSSTEYEGAGLGLAICNKIIENYGRKIWMESETGKGSTFYFSLKKEIVSPRHLLRKHVSSYEQMAVAS